MSTEATTPTATETTTTVETAPSTAAPAAPSEAEVSAAIESMGELTAAQLDAIDNGDFSSLAPPPADKGDGKSTPPDAGNTADTPAAAADPKSAERVHRLSLGGLPAAPRWGCGRASRFFPACCATRGALFWSSG